MTRKEAKEAGLKHYVTGLPCKRGHYGPRLTSTYACIECSRLDGRRRYRAHPRTDEDRRKRLESDRRNLTPGKRRARYWKYRGKLLATRRVRESLPESKEKKRKADREYYKANRTRYIAAAKRRKAAKARRVPNWLTNDDHQKIRKMYEVAEDYTKATGEKYSVDHIIPLRGKRISGLHVPENLEVVLLDYNLQKNDNFEPYSEVVPPPIW